MWWVLLATVHGLTITSRSTVDFDLNGYIDAINFTFDAPVSDVIMNDAVRNFAFTISGYFFDTDAGWITGQVVDDNNGFILIEEGVSYDTGVTPGVLYDSTIVPGLQPESSFVTALDRAAPVVVNATIQAILTTCGQVQILSSESIVTGGLDDAYRITTPDVADTLATCFTCSPPSDRVSLVLPDASPPFPLYLSPKLLSTYLNTNAIDGVPQCLFYYFNITNHNLTGTVQDAAGNTVIQSTFAVTATDFVSVLLVAAGSIDSNQNGYIDGYRAMFNMPMADANIVGEFSVSWFYLNFVPVPDTLTRMAATTCDGPIERTNTDQFWCVEVTENIQGGYNTDLTGKWGIPAPGLNQATGWVGGGGFQVEDFPYFGSLLAGNGSLLDWAAPVLIQVAAYDSKSTGNIDTVVLSFTEPVQKNTTAGGDWTSQSTSSVTVLNSAPVFQTASQLVFSLAPSGQTLNTHVPAIQYSRYKPTFTDLNGNPIERRTALLFEVPVLQSARSRVGAATIVLHFTYNATTVTLGSILFVGDNNITGLVCDDRDVTVTLLFALTQNEADTASISAQGVVVPITTIATVVYVNQDLAETDVLPASPPQASAQVDAGCAWQGNVNALFIVNGTLSVSDFNNTFRFFQARVNGR